MLKKIITLYTLCIPILIYSTHITFISPSSKSHFYTLQKAAISIKEIHPEYEVKFIILEYTNNNLSKGIEQLQDAHITVSTKTDLLLLKIAKNYIDYLKNLGLDLKHTNLIVYDHWILEAEIIGRYLHIPTICCLSGALAPYNHMQQTLNAQKNKKREKFQTIEQTFHISCFDDLQWKFNHLILPSQYTNVLYGYPLLIKSRKSEIGRNLHNLYYVIDTKPLIQNENFVIPQKQNNQKLIYMAFGGNLDSKDFLKDFLQNIYTWLTQNFGNNENYIRGRVNIDNDSLFVGGYSSGSPTGNSRIFRNGSVLTLTTTPSGHPIGIRSTFSIWTDQSLILIYLQVMKGLKQIL
jgi:hypothetical protein